MPASPADGDLYAHQVARLVDDLEAALLRLLATLLAKDTKTEYRPTYRPTTQGVAMTSTATDSPLVAHARRELALAGLLGKDSDYDGMLGEAALQIVETFATQGHSGMSAFATVDIAQRLMSYEPLTPLTNDPAEWNHIADDMAGRPDLWQSARKPDAFSNDGGLTYKVTGSDEAHTSAPARARLTR